MLAVAVAATAAVAQAPTAANPSTDALRATLPNGLRVVIVPNRLAPVVTTELNYLVGSNDAPEGFPGTAHALEHMMFRGSAGLDKEQLAELGALLGGVYNASTTETVTKYTYTVSSKDLGLVLKSEALRMRGLSLNEADWVQERGAIEQEVSRDLSNPFYNFLSQAQSILFRGTPYAHDALGSRPSFDLTDATLLRQFYERWYAPNNAILVIAGDVQPAQALSEVQAAFGDIPARTLPEHLATKPKPVTPETLSLSTNFSAGLIALAFRMPGLRSEDFAAADILGDVLGSRRAALYGLVPAGKALLAQFSYQAKPDVGYGLALAAFPKGNDPAPLLAELKQVIADTVRDGVSPELVAAAKQQEIAQLAFANDSISGLAGNWSMALASMGANSPDDLARAYGAVKVEDVDRLARQLLDLDHAVTAILTPESSGQAAAGTGFGGAELFERPPEHPVTLPSWASAALAEAALPDAGEPPDVSVLPNGLRLIVQPEHVGHTVSVYGRVRTVREVQEPPGKEGVAALLNGLFSYGTEQRDRLAFRKAVDDIAASVNAGQTFSLRALTPQFERGMELLAENQLHPALPADAFAVSRGQLSQSLTGLLQSPSYQFRQAANKAILPEGDPALRQMTPASVASVQLSDLRAYFAETFRPDLTTIVVLGDITPEEARRVVASTFGGWRASGPTPTIDLPAVRPNAPSQARVPDSSSLQDSVELEQSIPLSVDNPERYALMLGNAILGSGFSSRLYRDLRIRTGYVYSVSSSLSWSRTRAEYSVSFGSDPANVEKSSQLVVQNLLDMQNTLVSDTELSRARAQLIRQIPMQRANVAGIAGLYLRLVDLGLPLESSQLAASRYLHITAPEIQQAFSKWLRPQNLAQIVKGPPLQP